MDEFQLEFKMMLSMSALMGLFLIVESCSTQETPTPKAGEPAKAAEPAATPAAPAAAAAPAPPKIDKGDTAWMLTSAGVGERDYPRFVPFDGGLVRGKNALGTIMQKFHHSRLDYNSIMGAVWSARHSDQI